MAMAMARQTTSRPAPLANGFGILAQFLTAQTWAAPETQNHWRRLDSKFNHLDGRKRVGASVASRVLPARTQEMMDLPHVTLYFEIPTPRRLPALNRPAHSIVHMWALHKTMPVAPAASLLAYPRLTT
jgi:hypothetical protein